MTKRVLGNGGKRDSRVERSTFVRRAATLYKLARPKIVIRFHCIFDLHGACRVNFVACPSHRRRRCRYRHSIRCGWHVVLLVITYPAFLDVTLFPAISQNETAGFSFYRLGPCVHYTQLAQFILRCHKRFQEILLHLKIVREISVRHDIVFATKPTVIFCYRPYSLVFTVRACPIRFTEAVRSQRLHEGFATT